MSRRPVPLLTALVAVVSMAIGLRAQGNPDNEAPSPWYLERAASSDFGEARIPLGVPPVVAELEALLRDGYVPGFYDGQFAATADRFEELREIAHDEDMHHVIRVMAVMALQEAAEGEQLREALEPLLVSVQFEQYVDQRVALRFFAGNTPAGIGAEQQVRQELLADLSKHVRFALAKGGQPAAVLERIELLELSVQHLRDVLLDPQSEPTDFRIFFGRSQWFSIAYHYQQFDDYENATIWFRALTEHLRGTDSRWAHYNLACIAALQGRPEEALVELRGAIEDGFSDLKWMDEDGDLASLRGRAEFQELRVELGGLPISNTESVESSPAPDAVR
ncbi:MAG: hypothetical protein DHS20C15_00870 [Planctomycetota bacterium]|nr:MAG: hypothetical protein DHS20C15_00870 [Planctomycetota bacterium]